MQLPKHQFWGVGQQIPKSAKAIQAHIAQGYGRKSYPAEYRRFAQKALSSCDETVVHLNLLHDCGSISNDAYSYFSRAYDIPGKQLNKWLSTLERFMKSSAG